MALWGTTDTTGNSAIFAPAQVGKDISTTERDALYTNATADAYFTGATIGQYMVDKNEIAASRQAGDSRPAHTGWVLRTEGSGGRAGRVHYEVLVAMKNPSGDGSDDTVLPDYTIVISTQPVDATANSSADEQATFTIAATTVPTGGSLTYLWKYTTEVGNTNSFATTVAVPGFSGQTTTTLTVDANTIADATLLQCVVSVTGGDSVTSDNAELTVT